MSMPCAHTDGIELTKLPEAIAGAGLASQNPPARASA